MYKTKSSGFTQQEFIKYTNPFNSVFLFHNLISSSIRTLTVGNGISPYQSRIKRESRTFTAGRELHPALKKFK